ncbi:MAG: outer membrane beta-barrel protein [Tannerellaceae bacterium]|jgi:hypothetical protein|nr:outer membrane beta-barrel protein [Tannerellaceae bacterium]
MIDKERDIVDDLFRLKLQDMEADTIPEDWDAIARRLTEAKRIPLRRRQWLWAAAVLAALLLGGGIVYLSQQQDTGQDSLAINKENVQTDPPKDMPAIPPVPADEPALIAKATQTPRQPLATPLFPEEISPEEISQAEESTSPETKPEPSPETNPESSPETQPEEPISIQSQTLIADAGPIQTEKKASSLQKWGFGAGVGGLTQNSGDVVNTYVLRSSKMLEDEELLSLNAPSDQNLGKTPKTNIKHKTPISFGLSVSRRLNNRFSLQTGLVYSLLISDWETEATAYNTKTRQTLHFVGVPLSLSYKIAEWKRFQVYASTGALAEVNVAGGLRVKKYSNSLQTGVEYTNERMREWQWSVNARAGISYPLIPYINAFAEIGAAYYFDNGSKIETIYSDKAFNISPQIGFRLSF